MKTLQRIKRYWALSKKDPKALEKLEKLTDEELAYIPEIGDGKAVFFDGGTEEEWKELEHQDKFGGIKKLFGL